MNMQKKCKFVKISLINDQLTFYIYCPNFNASQRCCHPCLFFFSFVFRYYEDVKIDRGQGLSNYTQIMMEQALEYINR